MQTYTPKKFPPLCNAVFSRLNDEKKFKLMDRWMAVIQHYADKYADEFGEVSRLTAKLRANVERDAAEEKKKEEEDEPTNPGQGTKRESMLMLSDECVAAIETELEESETYGLCFDGDDYATRFRKVNGELRAWDPRFPDGRKVSCPSRGPWDVNEDKMLSFRCVLGLCLSETKTPTPADIGAMRVVEGMAARASVTHVDEGLRLSMLAVAFLLGNKHKDIVTIGIEGRGLALAAKHDRSKDEVVLDMIELMSVIN
jgi:hypothetical protein